MTGVMGGERDRVAGCGEGGSGRGLGGEWNCVGIGDLEGNSWGLSGSSGGALPCCLLHPHHLLLQGLDL